jgi:hypothetical protein
MLYKKELNHLVLVIWLSSSDRFKIMVTVVLWFLLLLILTNRQNQKQKKPKAKIKGSMIKLFALKFG